MARGKRSAAQRNPNTLDIHSVICTPHCSPCCYSCLRGCNKARPLGHYSRTEDLPSAWAARPPEPSCRTRPGPPAAGWSTDRSSGWNSGFGSAFVEFSTKSTQIIFETFPNNNKILFEIHPY